MFGQIKGVRGFVQFSLRGLEKMRGELDKVFAGLAGSKEKWERRKAELSAGKRWVELLY